MIELDSSWRCRVARIALAIAYSGYVVPSRRAIAIRMRLRAVSECCFSFFFFFSNVGILHRASVVHQRAVPHQSLQRSLDRLCCRSRAWVVAQFLEGRIPLANPGDGVSQADEVPRNVLKWR